MSSICFWSSLKNSFLMSCLKVFRFIPNFILSGRVFHAFGWLWLDIARLKEVGDSFIYSI